MPSFKDLSGTKVNRLNIMKRNHDQEYFIDLCKKVAEHNKKGNENVN